MHGFMMEIAEDIDPWPKSGLSEVKLNKFMFLNKEYSNLNKKLNWIKINKFSCVFSHYHNCKIWQKKPKLNLDIYLLRLIINIFISQK